MNLNQPTDSPSAEVKRLLQAGIAAAKAGQRQQARDLLMQVVELDQTNITAWLWLSGVVESRSDKEACLENVLTLDPNHQTARQGLELLQKSSANPPTPSPGVSATPAPPAIPIQTQASPPAATSSPVKPAGPVHPSQAPSRSTPSSYPKLSPSTASSQADPLKPGHLKQHASIAASILQPDFAARQQPVDQGERDAPEDAFANEYLCPYCAKRTRPDDKRCKTCHNKLWIYIPRRSKPSKLYYFFMWNIGLNIVIVLFLIALVIAVGLEDHSIRNSGAFYFVLALLGFSAVYYTVILIGYFKRWRILYYLNVIAAVLVMAEAGMYGLINSLTSTSGMICGGFLFLLSVVWFFMILNLGEDFAYDKYRLILRVDPDVKTAKNIFHRGNQYSQRKMWALAAVHYRRAVGQMPDDINCHLALALTYLHLNMLDKADETLSEARRISSIDPLLQKLTQELERKRST